MRKWIPAVVFVFAAMAVIVPFTLAVIVGDPAKLVDITSGDARARVIAFVSQPELTADLDVTGPHDGAYMRYYDVMGRSVIASVNAHDGTVATIYYLNRLKVSLATPPVSKEVATDSAMAFLDAHHIDVDGLAISQTLQDHGDTSEWVVSWQARADAVVLPKYHEVGIDSTTGLVFRYASINHPYDVPGKPQISQSVAESTARSISGLPTVTSSQLIVTFANDGTQHLVYDIMLEGPDTATPSSGVVIAAEVRVDAMTGDATVVAVG